MRSFSNWSKDTAGKSSAQKCADRSRIDTNWVSTWRRVGACIAITLSVCGCSSPDEQYWREGIGTHLDRPGMPDALQLQQMYLDYICQQAMPVITTGQSSQCSYEPIPSKLWPLIVQAGMNDIDERCDAYLAWIDEKKRSEGPILQEISDIQTATTAILTVTGVGVAPIGIVASAFGLATKTFTNINNTLISTADKSTIQAVVLGRRGDYRVEVAKATIDSRPAAIHALRDYLSLCMPFTIETDINLTVSSYQKGGTTALDRRVTPNTNTLINTKTIATTAATIITDVNKKFQNIPNEPALTSGQFTNTERALENNFPQTIRNYQSACGVTPDGHFGGHGSPTRQKLLAYLVSQNPNRRNQTPDADVFGEKDINAFDKGLRTKTLCK